MSLSENKSLCGLPFSHLFLSPQGYLKPCCRFKSTDQPYNQSFKEAFEGAEWQDLRRKMLNGDKVDGCIRCYEEELSGKKSLRMRYNSHPKLGLAQQNLRDPAIQWLEIAFSNRCNVACRMCDSRYSTRWARDEKALYGKSKATTPLFEFDLQNLVPMAAGLKHVKITGGEPFFDVNHKKFLRILAEEARPEQIYLNYSTNLTLFPDEEVISHWKRFERVEIALSLDSIFPRETNYMRYPTDGALAVENTKRFIQLLKSLPNLHLIFRSTVNIFNIFSIPETYLWWIQQREENPSVSARMSENPTHLTYPEYLRATCLKSHQKTMVSEKFKIHRQKGVTQLNGVLDYLESYLLSEDKSDLYDEFVLRTQKLDRLRKQNYSEVFEHLS